MPPRGRSPGASPRDRVDSPRRSVSPRTANSRSRSPSYERDTARRNGEHSRSRSRSLSRSRGYSRGRSRSRSWTPDARRRKSRSFSRTPTPKGTPQRSSKIVIEKLTKNVTGAHIQEIFGSFGDIQSIDLPMNRAFMTNRGTAYVLYYDPADAEAAIAHMHEAQLDGATLNVSIVLPRRAFSRSPPPAAPAGRGGGRPKFGRGQHFDNRHSRISPNPRRSPRRQGRARQAERHDLYRPRSRSRSWSPRRSRSFSSKSRSVSPPRKSRSPRRRKRRSPSYSSYSSRGDRSRSPSKNRSKGRN